MRYRPTTQDKADGTFGCGNIETSYAELSKVLGEPNGQGDDYKVSTSWVLEGPLGAVEVHDWKVSDRYFPEGLPLKKIRGKQRLVWTVGAKENGVASDFVAWLRERGVMLAVRGG